MGRGNIKSINFKAVREAAVQVLGEISEDTESVVKRDYYGRVYNKYYDKTRHKMHYNNYIPTERIQGILSENFFNENGWKSCTRRKMMNHLEGRHIKAVRCITRLVS
jgi:hypothetical protein